MGISKKTLELVDSFEDCWKTFENRSARLIGDHPVNQEEDEELLAMKSALVERYQRVLQTDFSSRIPESIKTSITSLESFKTFSVLSDQQIQDFKKIVTQTRYDLDQWMLVVRRQNLSKAKKFKEKQKEGLQQYFLIPAIFLFLTLLLLFVGVQFFLNR